MLDAYIIDKIKKEQEQVREDRLELEIHPPSPPVIEPEIETPQKRGVEVIDFTI
jgi:hypothetical protein